MVVITIETNDDLVFLDSLPLDISHVVELHAVNNLLLAFAVDSHSVQARPCVHSVFLEFDDPDWLLLRIFKSSHVALLGLRLNALFECFSLFFYEIAGLDRKMLSKILKLTNILFLR